MTTFLLSSAGRRGALVHILKEVANETGGRVITVDASPLSAAGHLADSFEIVPRLDQDGFIDAVLEVATRTRVDVVIPTIDPEIVLYSRSRERFADQGIDVWAPSLETAQLGFDKWEFFTWLKDHDIPTVETHQASDIRWRDLAGPAVVKPRSGSSSIGVTFTPSVERLPLNLPSDHIVQAVARGIELTVDFAVCKGQFLGAVPRQRLEIRAGEVSKGLTVRNSEVEHLTESLAMQLPGMHGVGNVQMFFDPTTGDIAVIEINPRFGGGYPLTHAAGADFVTAMLESSAGRSRPPASWQAGVTMLRYDAAVFVRDEIDKPK